MELSPLKETVSLMTTTCRVYTGKKTKDEDNYLTNFVIEAYLELIAIKGISQGAKVEFLGWESFEKGFSARELKRKSTFYGTGHCFGPL